MSEPRPPVIAEELRCALEARESARYRLTPGMVIDGLRVEGGLGVGTFGEVYAVHDRALDGHYALKLLRRGENEAREAFRREARLLARLRHPNIVRVMRAGEWRGWPFFVMERLDPLPDAPDARRVLAWMLALCGALTELNRQGVTHGDVKYGNILWDAARREPVLVDLGAVAPLVPGRGGAEADVYALGCLARRLLPHRALKPGSPWRAVLTEALVADSALRIQTPEALAARLCAAFALSGRKPPPIRNRRFPARRKT